MEETCVALRHNGHAVQGVTADVCDAEQVQHLVDRTVETFGKVDLLLNNAGFTRDKYLVKMLLSDWDAVIDTPLHPPWRGCAPGQAWPGRAVFRH